MTKTYFIYLMTNKNLNVIYTGVTNDLIRRVDQHKSKLIKGFTEKYNVNKLVYFEPYENIIDAITREKEIKGWTRKKKNILVQQENPDWKDLFDSLF